MTEPDDLMLAKQLREPLVQDRDPKFVESVHKKLARGDRTRSWSAFALRVGGVLLIAFALETARYVVFLAVGLLWLAPAAGHHGFLLVPIFGALAAMVLLSTFLASLRI